MEACREAGIKYIELPVAYDALTVVDEPEEQLGQADHGRGAQEDVGARGAGQDQEVEPGQPGWPERAAPPVRAGVDSGTYDYFTEAINGKAKSSRGDYTASEDDNVLVQGISSDKVALGYFGFAYYTENKDKLKAVPTSARAGKRRVPSLRHAKSDGTYQPLSRPIFIYVSAKAMRAPRGEGVRRLLPEARADADQGSRVRAAAAAAHYAQAKKNFASKKLGTGFGGKAEVGVKLDDLLAREGKL